ncbi:MAG: rRNA maturation RNase YbeY [Candidatus Buchananbacteria bacterium]|nr:rRNA maturation RNase YbeY [Candidatus Buchananbacteria bacterium]
MVRFEVNQQAGKKITASVWRSYLKPIEAALKLKKPLEISIGIVGDAAIKKLNKIYRHKDKVTDVLSFGETNQLAGGNKNYLGEIIICYPQAVRQAKKAGHPLNRELQLLFTHGFLHLLGYDHEKDSDAEVMEGLEEKILGFRR